MEPLFEQLKKARNEIRLDLERKNIIRGNLSRLIEADLAIKKPVGRHFLYQLTKVPAIIFVIIFLIGGGTSLAAEKTLPGDLLYIVKKQVNEPVVGALSFGVEAKGDWEAELASRRLEEASRLALQGKLDAKTETELSDEFETHEEKTLEHMAKLEENGKEREAASLAARFEGTLQGHEKIAARTAQSDTGATMMMSAKIALPEAAPPPSRLETKISKALSSATETRVRLEKKIKSDNSSSTEHAANAKIKAAGKILLETKKYVAKKENKLRLENASEIEALLTLSDELLIQAKVKNEAGLYGEAFNLANDAIRIAHESKTAVDVRSEMQTDEKNDADRDEALPLETGSSSEHGGSVSGTIGVEVHSDLLKGTTTVAVEKKNSEELINIRIRQ
ncbi:MAG: hypothetical protein AAB691_04705 [Patescibacteria group bacterium]